MFLFCSCFCLTQLVRDGANCSRYLVPVIRVKDIVYFIR